jgi:hypothetical protein
MWYSLKEPMLNVILFIERVGLEYAIKPNKTSVSIAQSKVFL